MIQEIINNIVDRCQSCNAINDIQAFSVALTAELGKYNITEKETALVPHDEKLNKGYMMFFVAKSVEGMAERSLKYYRYVIDYFINFIQKPIDIITTDDVRYYLARKQIETKCAPSTIDNERRILNTFFKWLSDEGYVTKNICSSIKKVKTPKKKKKAFTETDIAKIKDACNKIENSYKQDEYRKRAIAIIEFLLSTGCRVGEISTLKREDIDMDNRVATVTGKGNKQRNVYLTPVCKMRLIEYWECTGVSEWCFSSLTSNKSKVGISGIEVMVRNIGDISGVANCHPHRFRRTCATMAIKKGMSLIDVQRMLGHESMDTTKIYLDLDDTDLKYQHDKIF